MTTNEIEKVIRNLEYLYHQRDRINEQIDMAQNAINTNDGQTLNIEELAQALKKVRLQAHEIGLPDDFFGLNYIGA